MKLIIGLGNPGKKYEGTRHNTGAMALAEFLSENTPPFAKWKENKKLKSALAKGEINDEEIILALPLTYMNESGEAVRLLASYYKLAPSDLIVIHDDLDLPLGKIRLSRQGSSAGHRGVQSIIDRLKAKDFVRIRIGILTNEKKKIPTEKYVLQRFSPAEKPLLAEAIKKTLEAINLTLKSGPEKAMNKIN